MEKRKHFLICLLLGLTITGYSQVPVIQKIERTASFNKSTVIISGSGFSTNSAQLQVWFDHVKGIIKASSEFSIEVEVPPQAKLDNIRVVNLISKLSAQSGAKFMPVFSGEGFDASKLAAPLTISSPNSIFDIISMDVDGDNKPDLVGSREDDNATTMALIMNQSTPGNISFSNTVIPSLNINAPTGFLASGDVNGDGKTDVVAVRSGTTANTVFVLINTSTTGNPSFAAPIILSLELTHFAREARISDLNGDGKPEIIVTNSNTNDLYIFKNESSGGTTSINPNPVKVTITGSTESLALDVQDLDSDGKKDLITTRSQKSDLYILRNTSTSSAFSFTITKITAAGSFNDVATADFNNDGKLDIVASSIFSGQAQVFLNQSNSGSITFTPFPITVSTDTNPFGLDVSDLNGDGFADFIVASRGINTLNAFLNNGNVTSVGFTKVVINSAKTNWAVRAGDLDGDAKPDIAFTSFTGETINSVDILRNRNCHKPRILNETPINICASQTIRLLAIPMPGVTYNWSNGFSSIKNNTDPFVDVSVAATYTVTAASEGTSCSVVSNAIVINAGAGTAPAEPVINANTPLCAGSSLNLTTSTIAGASYAWSGPNNFTSTQQNPTINNVTAANAGNYSLLVKVGDCSSNRATKNVEVVSFSSFSISSSSANNSACQGQTITLTVNNETGYSYQWMKDNSNITGQTSTSLAVTTGGVYKVKVTNTALGCSQETPPVTVLILQPPVAAFTMPASGCVGNAISFTNSSTTDPSVTTPVTAWDFGDSQTSTQSSPTHTYSSANTYTVKLTISYSGVTGCTNSVSKSIPIGAGGTQPVITATKNEICQGQESILSLNTTYASYQWSTNATTATITVTTPGTYTVNTTETNGCAGQATITIGEPTDCNTTPSELDFPPAFTPNGDLSNDTWIIPGIEQFGECTMNVFDGQGRRVYQVTGYPSGGWDGTFDGKEVPQGTYYFVFSCPNAPAKTGSILIVK